MSGFSRRYAACFDDYLRAPQEDTLRAAYELGREAVQDGLGIVDLAMAHHMALRMALRDGLIEEATLGAAEDFLLESVAAFEMVQRGFKEASDSAALQRRHAGMLRQLSDFLADASLALQASDSLDEMLRLVCEQARELASAACCMVTLGEGAQARFRAASYPGEDLDWRAFAAWSDLSRVDRAVRDVSRAVRIRAGEAGELVPAVEAHRGELPGEWLGVALCALDGRPLGAIHVIKGVSGRFTELDEAVITHLGQMAAAAVERALLYAGESSSDPRSRRDP